MSGRFFLSGTTPLYEGEPQPLATLTFSVTGTSTPLDTYTTPGLTVANANPVVADANGYFGEIFLKRERYKVILKNAAGTTLKTWDPVDKDVVFTRGAGLPSDPHPGQRHANTSDGHTYEYKLDTAAWLDLGATDAVGNTATVTEQLTGTSASVYSTPDSVAGLWQRGTDIASASTLSLPSTGGGVFNVTGTTGVTAISSAQGGRCIKLKFAGALTITHNGTSLILPGAANITTVAGDMAEFINEAAANGSGSNWRCFRYSRASGSPLNITDNLIVATQSEAEAASVQTSFLSPGRAQHHPGVAKCRVQYDQSSGTATAQGVSYNLSSLTDGATGLATVNMTTAMSSGFYHIAGITQRPSTNNDAVISINTGTTPSTTAFQLATTVAASNVDMTWVSAVAHGDQS